MQNITATMVAMPVLSRVVKLTGLSLMFIAMVSSTAIANHAESGHDRRTQRQAAQYSGLSPYLGIGLGFGGDEIGRFEDSNGDLDVIHSGGGLLLEAGLALAVDGYTSLRLTSGYQLDGTRRLNGDSSFDRIRFDLTLLRHFDAHEIGAGVTAHTSVGYSCTINSICEGDVDFDHAVGFTLEYAVRVGRYGYYRSDRFGGSRGLRLGVRYTGIDYRPRLPGVTGNADVTNGNTLSGFVGVVF